jgi:PLAT/LH2 domain-containing protein
MRRKLSALLATVAVFTLTLAAGQPPVAAKTSGNARSAAQTYVIFVQTGNIAGAGTDANVYVQILGTLGRSPVMELDSPADDFERGSYRGYDHVLNDLGDINRICLWRNNAGLFPDWNVDFVSVRAENGTFYTAPFNGWMPAYKWICRRAT